MLAKRIPDIMSLGPPAAAEQINDLAVSLGLELPDEYRLLLSEAKGVGADLVTIYPIANVPERNTTYQVAKYAPGYILIGTVNSSPVLLRVGRSSPVYENDWGAMTPNIMKQLAPNLVTWVEQGCPDSAELTADD